jgi:solute carrier family 35 protein C2
MDRIPENAKTRQSPQDSPAKDKPFVFPPPLAALSQPPSRSSSPIPRILADYGHSTNAEISGSAVSSPTADAMEGGTVFGHRRRRSSLVNGKSKSRGHSRLPSRAFLPVPGQLQIDEESDRQISADEGSDLSAQSTSDDVELEELHSEDGFENDEETGLTSAERKERTRRKLRRMQLDERVAVDHKSSRQEQMEADQSVIKNSIINAILIGLWYMFSLSISVVGRSRLIESEGRRLTMEQYNTWMFSGKHLNFHFPLFTTCMHMLVQFSLASLVLFALPQFRPRADALTNPHNIVSSNPHGKSTSDQPLMSRMFYLTRIGPCGAATGLDIGLGNRSLEFISLAFYSKFLARWP